MKRSHGPQSKHSRNLRSQGRVAITRFLQTFKEGDRVRINVNPAIRKGRPTNLRFNYLNGVVASKRGNGYVVKIKDCGKGKEIVVTNAHLVKV